LADINDIKSKAQRALRASLQGDAQRREYYAKLGDGSGNVDTGRANYVFARVSMPDGITVSEVLCVRLTPVNDLPVRIATNTDDQLEVMSFDPTQIASYYGDDRPPGGGGPHGWTHQRLAIDPVQLGRLQVRDLLTTPTDPASTSVYIDPYFYRTDAGYQYWQGGTVDLSAYIPGTLYQHRPLLIGIDGNTNTAQVLSGSVELYPGMADTINPFTGEHAARIIPPDDFIESAGVRVRYGQTQIQGYDLFLDARQWSAFSYGGGVNTFLALEDTPSAYGGNAGQFVAVNSAEDGLVFSNSQPVISAGVSFFATPTGRFTLRDDEYYNERTDAGLSGIISITASSQEGGFAPNFVRSTDGNPWRSANTSPPHWIEYQFITAKDMALAYYRAGAYLNPSGVAKDFKIQYYDGGWIDAYSISSNTSGILSPVLSGDSSTRWRMYVTGVVSGNQVEVERLGLYTQDTLPLLAQSFTVPSSIKLETVQLRLKRVGNPVGNIQASIYSNITETSRPDMVITNGDFDAISASAVDTSYEDISFTTNSQPTLAGSTRYWLVLSGDYTFDKDNAIQWGYAAGSPYDELLKVYNGTTWYDWTNGYGDIQLDAPISFCYAVNPNNANSIDSIVDFPDIEFFVDADNGTRQTISNQTVQTLAGGTGIDTANSVSGTTTFSLTNTGVTFAADSGTNQTINLGNTFNILGGNGIDTAMSADTVTIDNVGVYQFAGNTGTAFNVTQGGTINVTGTAFMSVEAIPPNTLQIALEEPAYGTLYVQNETPTAQTGIGTSFTTVTGFEGEGESNGVTLSAANDNITVSSDGVYMIGAQTSFSGSNNVTYTMRIYVNGTGQIACFRRKLGASGDVGSASIAFTPLVLSANDVIDLRVKADSAGQNISMYSGQLSVYKIV
jgi:hypothetical protein